MRGHQPAKGSEEQCLRKKEQQVQGPWGKKPLAASGMTQGLCGLMCKVSTVTGEDQRNEQWSDISDTAAGF